MKKKICIIEDEKDIVRLLSFNLTKEGYDVVSYGSGDQALAFVLGQRPDLILLDIMIPVQDGFDVCKQLRAHPSTASIPIIMLTAKSEESNIVTGLELGADDYITKPFSVAVLVARIRVALRRPAAPVSASEESVTVDGLSVYPDRHEVYVHGEMVHLTLTEFKLLHSLMLQPGRVLSRNQLIDFMKGEDYFVTPKLVDVFVVSLRKKLGELSILIQTVRGVGYKFKSLS